jgi:hypothetical protein
MDLHGNCVATVDLRGNFMGKIDLQYVLITKVIGMVLVGVQ